MYVYMEIIINITSTRNLRQLCTYLLSGFFLFQ